MKFRGFCSRCGMRWKPFYLSLPPPLWGRARVGGKGREKMGYQKFCYWVDSHGLKTVRKNLEEKENQLIEETRIPCRALKASLEIAYLAPQAWNGFCKRRISWYRKSEMADKLLIVSNSPLDIPDLDYPIVITESNFKPDRFPSSNEISQLIQSREYQKKKPS